VHNMLLGIVAYPSVSRQDLDDDDRWVHVRLSLAMRVPNTQLLTESIPLSDVCCVCIAV
jgi:hypothetical protein